MNLKFTVSSIIILALALVSFISFRTEEVLPPASSQTYFPISIDGHELKLQLALSSTEQKKGLMYREKLAKDHGMLFLFNKPEQRSFWMRNTSIPLDVAYFDDRGKLIEIHPLFPYDETSVVSTCNEILIAVETNQKWFSKKGIKSGAYLDLEALNYALKRRSHIGLGIDP